MDKKVSRKYFNDNAEFWDKIARNNDPLKLRALADRLLIPKQSWVLDVGTGTGVFLPYIKEKGQLRKQHCLHGLRLQYAEDLAKAKQKGNVVQYICAEIETLRFCPRSFDVVICYSTFPHFHDKPHAIGNILLAI